jgi:hypothetical protein
MSRSAAISGTGSGIGLFRAFWKKGASVKINPLWFLGKKNYRPKEAFF